MMVVVMMMTMMTDGNNGPYDKMIMTRCCCCSYKEGPTTFDCTVTATLFVAFVTTHTPQPLVLQESPHPRKSPIPESFPTLLTFQLQRLT